MSTLSLFIDRFIKLFIGSSLFIAIIVLIIPTCIVGIQNHQQALFDQTTIKGKAKKTPQQSKANTLLPSNLISLGWVNGANNTVSNYKHLQIVSPDFATIEPSGHIKLLTSLSSIKAIHQTGKSVWGRISMYSQTHRATHSFLDKTKARNQVVKEIRKEASKTHLDGINIDIESVQAGDRKAFTAFIGQLSKALKVNHINLSIDIQPENKSLVTSNTSYNKQLGKFCDYIVFMGYDEHWAADPTPGPVTSLQWLKDNVNELIKTGIPSHKLILGLPAYTRIWQVNNNGKTIKSLSLANNYVTHLMQKNNRPGKWKANLGAYYISYHKQGKHYETWLTNTRSITDYISLISTYHLAGFGFWSLNFMSASAWNQLYQSVVSRSNK